MKRKSIWILLLAGLIIAAMSALCYADAEETGVPETTVAETPAEFAEATADAEPEGDSVYAYKRLMVFVGEGSLAESYGAAEAVYYAPGGYYLLTYGTKSEAKAAHDALKQTLGENKVFVDAPTETQGLPAQDVANDTPSDSVSYGNDLMHLDAVRDYYNANPSEGSDVLVAVIDSGIRSTHEMFSYEENGKTYSRLQLNEDACFVEDSIEDRYNGHGTHVAGIIADGTSRHVKIMPVRTQNNSGYGSQSTLYNGLLYAESKDADIVNMSLGWEYEYAEVVELLDPVFQRLQKKGTLCVAAAGNSKKETSYPASSPYVTSVSALKYEKDENGNRQLEFDSGYSNFGDISFCAPGTEVNSAFIRSDTDYLKLPGTSMACPHVVAAAAMYKVVNPEYTPQEIKYMMFYRAEHFTFVDDAKQYIEYGSGMPYFRKGYVEKVPSVRGVNFKLSQKTFVYSGKKAYMVEVPTGTRKENGKTITYVSPDDFWALSHENYDDVGTATVGIRGREPHLVGDKYYTYQIIPAGTTVKKLTGGKKKITVKWKKQAMKMSKARIDGYQIQIATNKTFTKGKKTVTVKGYAKTSKVIKKLKAKKKYYVRIRTYMKVRGKTYYSKWSGKKAVKTKK